MDIFEPNDNPLNPRSLSAVRGNLQATICLQDVDTFGPFNLSSTSLFYAKASSFMFKVGVYLFNIGQGSINYYGINGTMQVPVAAGLYSLVVYTENLGTVGNYYLEWDITSSVFTGVSNSGSVDLTTTTGATTMTGATTTTTTTGATTTTRATTLEDTTTGRTELVGSTADSSPTAPESRNISLQAIIGMAVGGTGE